MDSKQPTSTSASIFTQTVDKITPLRRGLWNCFSEEEQAIIGLMAESRTLGHRHWDVTRRANPVLNAEESSGFEGYLLADVAAHDPAYVVEQTLCIGSAIEHHLRNLYKNRPVDPVYLFRATMLGTKTPQRVDLQWALQFSRATLGSELAKLRTRLYPDTYSALRHEPARWDSSVACDFRNQTRAIVTAFPKNQFDQPEILPDSESGLARLRYQTIKNRPGLVCQQSPILTGLTSEQKRHLELVQGVAIATHPVVHAMYDYLNQVSLEKQQASPDRYAELLLMRQLMNLR